jgi:hypothetical protein
LLCEYYFGYSGTFSFMVLRYFDASSVHFDFPPPNIDLLHTFA